MSDWRRDLLGMIEAPATPGNLRLLANWQRWEGGHTKNKARFNWLNTTMDAPGVTGSINSVGVKSFADRRSGVNALAMTLLNGRYNDIVAALRSGRPYTHDISAGLSTWVSGSPDGNLGYAAKVTGKAAGEIAGAPTRAGRAPTRKAEPASAPRPSPVQGLLDIAFEDDPEMLALLKSFRFDGASDGGRNRPSGGTDEHAGHSHIEANGKNVAVPMNWRGSHVSDGLGWGTKTAIDIMGAPGTAVSLPEAVTVVYFHPDGAQGGGSMLVRTRSGREYWIGHIANGAAPGSQIPAGKPLAYISADHPRPHVHVDRRG